MMQLIADNFLPDVDACDEQAFANCLIDSDHGVNFNRFEHTSAKIF
jgi:hypothetical protein